MSGRNANRPIKINGEQYRPTLQDVLDAMYGQPVLPVQQGNWFGVVRGRKHPLKVVAATTLGLPRSAIAHKHMLAFARHVGLPFGQEPGVFRGREAA